MVHTVWVGATSVYLPCNPRDPYIFTRFIKVNIGMIDCDSQDTGASHMVKSCYTKQSSYYHISIIMLDIVGVNQ